MCSPTTAAAGTVVQLEETIIWVESKENVLSFINNFSLSLVHSQHAYLPTVQGTVLPTAAPCSRSAIILTQEILMLEFL